MFIATRQELSAAPAEPDVAAARRHRAPLERGSRMSAYYKHLVPPGPKAMFSQHAIPYYPISARL